ncbi:MAG: PTS cellobiose transporter subunit IIB [Proteobacteria bacterium]|nr:PTS cellobiose transporter subunit IIB [Pseudomonadota bacterium]
MDILYRSTIAEVGPEVADLLEGGLLILFQVGAPPELAEISVTHAPSVSNDAAEPRIADIVRFGNREARITAMGPRSWAKARDLGHITFSFGGAPSADRPGEICVTPIPHDELWTELVPGSQLEILRA